MRFPFVAAVSLVLAACSANRPGDTVGDDYETGAGDDDVSFNPFGGEDAVQVTFDAVFDAVVETCDVTLFCNGQYVTHSSNEPFQVNPSASCQVTLGTLDQPTADSRARPTHEDANGLLWTYSAEFNGFTEGTVELVADWYFEAEELRCKFGTREVVTRDVFVDANNTFEIEGVAGKGSWFAVDGASFDYAGREATNGWSVHNIHLGTNNLDFAVDMVSAEIDVNCTY